MGYIFVNVTNYRGCSLQPAIDKEYGIARGFIYTRLPFFPLTFYLAIAEICNNSIQSIEMYVLVYELHVGKRTR